MHRISALPVHSRQEKHSTVWYCSHIPVSHIPVSCSQDFVLLAARYCSAEACMHIRVL